MSKSQLLIQELQAKIERLRGLDKLEAKLAEAKEVVSKLEAEIAELTGEVIGKAKAEAGKRTRITVDALKVLEKSVTDLLKSAPHGMGDLVKKTGHKPSTLRKVLATVKAKSEGSKRSTVYSL